MDTKTPTKSFHSVCISPRSQLSVCATCGKDISNPDYRRKLFHGNTKSAICLLLEQTLVIEISSELTTHIACRNCVREVTSVKQRINKLRTGFSDTCKVLSISHGKTSTKRMLSESIHSPPKSHKSSCKTLFGSDTDDKEEQHQIETHIKSHHDFIEKLTSELQNLSVKSTPSILRETDTEKLMTLSYRKISAEWESRAPCYATVLKACTTNPSQSRNKYKKDDALLPGKVTAGAKLLSLFNKDLSVFKHLNSLVLLKGGAKRHAFSRLNATGDCLNYKRTLMLADKLADMWSEKLIVWKHKVEDDRNTEKKLTETLKDLEEYRPTDDSDHFITTVRISDAKSSLEHHKKSMHPGYYFVGDNVDMKTNVRQMTLKNQNKSQHMFQMCAYENRVSGNHVDNTSSKHDAKTIPFSSFIPSQEDKHTLAMELAFHVAWIWISHVPWFRIFEPVMDRAIQHQYMKETKTKSERVNMGVLHKNEQYTDEMTDICEFLHEYVPGHDDDETNWQTVPEKILSGGDYLTFERHKAAISSKRNCKTSSKRLEGLVPKMEEFHNQAEFLKVIWQLLYSTASSKDVGTLFAARNTLNAVKVTKKPAEFYYASSELMDRYTSAYVSAGAMEYFKLETLESEPTENKYNGEVGNPTDMKDYIMQQALSFVEEHVMMDMPQIPEFGHQSNTLKCRYCGKLCSSPGRLRKHEAKLHKHEDHKYMATSDTTEKITKSKTKMSTCTATAYTRLSLYLGLLRVNHNDAIKYGDGARIMRMNEIFYLYYKACDCPKYAFGILETLAGVKCLLTSRLAHRLVWNRTVNHQGEQDSNMPNDLDVEHCNKVFKDEAHSYRGVFTQKTVFRVSRSAMKTDELLRKFDTLNSVRRPSGKHTKADVSEDVAKLTKQLHKAEVYTQDARHYSGLTKFQENPLLSLDMDHVRSWIGESLDKFSERHFYSSSSDL